MNRWILLTVILVFFIVFTLVLTNALTQPEVKFPQTAIIVDQLGTDVPNPSFISNATNTLTNHGFNVSYTNQSLNVDFFGTLASSNYGIIILRVHSALRNDSSTVDLFTNEKYVDGTHQDEVDNGLLTKGQYIYEQNQYYFCLSSLFIGNLQGRFPKSIIIAMGCESLIRGDNPLAEAFIAKGAVAYIGWSDTILPNDTDAGTMNLLNMLLNQNMTLGDSVGSTSPYNITGLDRSNNTITVTSRMMLYPMSNENITVSYLISQSKSSDASFSNLAEAFILVPFLSRADILERLKKMCLRSRAELQSYSSSPRAKRLTA